SGDSDVNALDHDVALLFCIDNCLVHAFHRRFKIDDLPLAHAARWGLAYTEDFERAVGPALPNDNTDLGGANLETNHQIIVRHFFTRFSFADCELPWEKAWNRRAIWALTLHVVVRRNPGGRALQAHARGSPS